MPAVLIDVGYHLVEPDTSGQTVTLSVASTAPDDPAVAGFGLRAQIVTAKDGPNFQGVRFAGNLWNTFPHIESGGPLPSNPTLAWGSVAFTQGFEARPDGRLVTLTIDTTGIPAGSYEFRLVATQLGSSSLRRADGSSVSEIIKNGTLHVRSIWQNPDNPNDINSDERISPLDVLLLLNELSKNGSRELEMPSPGEESSLYYDVDGDGHISPKDAIILINCLNGLGCVTTPAPILAQVTADFEPDLADSTGVSKPAPGDPKSEDLPADEVDPEQTIDCLYYDYELDEYGTPIPVIDPVTCNEYTDADGNPIPVEPILYADVYPAEASAYEKVIESAAELLPAKSVVASTNFATVASSKSVDAVIMEIAHEISGESTRDGFFELGLDELFAVS
ncbi:MAG TPA: dockerin type I domain-containing protein [Pirellulaceae bacterium]|nr:dockerin type I domain-containing protein [Pirellulaceae bacterium]